MKLSDLYKTPEGKKRHIQSFINQLKEIERQVHKFSVFLEDEGMYNRSLHYGNGHLNETIEFLEDAKLQ